MSSPSSIFRRPASVDGAVVVTGPRCESAHQSTSDDHVKVEGPETIDETDTTIGSMVRNQLAHFLEGRPNIPEEKELEERTVRIVPLTSKPQDVNDFDICREYSYEEENEEEEGEQEPSANRGLLPLTASFLGFGNTTTASFEEAAESGSLHTYVLGKPYHPIRDYSIRRDDESSLFWFTYRCDFPEIKPYAISTDTGWGCMLRSAQMLIGQALRLHFKSRDWRSPSSLSSQRQDPFLRSFLTWFADFPSTNECIYSLHNMVASGLANYDKLPGEWYVLLEIPFSSHLHPFTSKIPFSLLYIQYPGMVLVQHVTC